MENQNKNEPLPCADKELEIKKDKILVNKIGSKDDHGKANIDEEINLKASQTDDSEDELDEEEEDKRNEEN